ncbi:hypothetical protein E2C01_047950 [Portunus trituberculatus]|uniref:Uncharacterized protein n=1 Tax=Portunus trituberculatus TaxID=210409 RepID=A0A5B7G9W4_PORTR|nr:hypothetical protein [Portunus trituberculatus]
MKQKQLKSEQRKRTTGKDVPPAEMGLLCKSTFCLKAKTHNCQFIAEEQRSQIFHKFWSVNSWDERRVYIQALISGKEIKQKKKYKTQRGNHPMPTVYNFLMDHHIKSANHSLLQPLVSLQELSCHGYMIMRSDRQHPCQLTAHQKPVHQANVVPKVESVLK